MRELHASIIQNLNAVFITTRELQLTHRSNTQSDLDALASFSIVDKGAEFHLWWIHHHVLLWKIISRSIWHRIIRSDIHLIWIATHHRTIYWISSSILQCRWFLDVCWFLFDLCRWVFELRFVSWCWFSSIHFKLRLSLLYSVQIKLSVFLKFYLISYNTGISFRTF
mgnify:CR=1 FL=1